MIRTYDEDVMMEKASDNSKSGTSIKLNMLMNVLLTMSSIVFPLITLPYVTRVLGPEGIGKVYFASSAIAFFSIFAEIGIPVYGIRACARVRDDRTELTRTAHEILIINAAACIAVYAVFAVCLMVVPRFTQDRLLLTVMSSTMILNSVGAEWLYKALEKYTYITVRSLIFKTAALIFIFAMVQQRSDYVVYGFLTISAAAASNIVNLILLHRHIDMTPTGRPDLRKHIPGMLALFSLAAATTIYANLDIAFLDLIRGDHSAGLYGVAVKIKLVLVNLITSVSAVLLPRVSFLAGKGEKHEYLDLLRNTMTGVNAISLPVVCFFVLYADRCIMVLAGSEFAGAVMPMRIIMPTVFFIGISNIIGMQMLIPMGREKAVSYAAWIGAVTDLALNAVLIPKFDASGAAAATLAAEILVMTYLVRAAGADAGRIVRPKAVLAATVVTVAAIPAALWAKSIFAEDLLTLVIGAACYFGCCIAIYCIVFAISRHASE